MPGQFDEHDKESWYFGGLTFDECKGLLNDEEVGVFLVRDSTRGGYVLCVREHSDVAQYPIKTLVRDSETKYLIRDELSFRDLPSLLAFYKRNLFESTALVRPISKERVDVVVPPHRRSEIPPSYCPKSSASNSRMSAPGVLMGDRSGDRGEFTPVYAKVIKSKNPSPYIPNLLELHIGDIIKITQMKDGSGEGEVVNGALNGKHGKFPLTHVELIKPFDDNK